MKMKSTFLKIFTAAIAVCFFAQYSVAQDAKFKQSETGIVVMEAENYSEIAIPEGTTETWEPIWDPANFSGESTMIAAPTDGGPFATADDALAGAPALVYSIEFIMSGPYRVWIRAHKTGGSDDSFHLGLNDDIPETGQFINWEEAVYGEDSVWAWVNHSGIAGGPAQIEVPSQEVHEFKIYFRESDCRIDKIILTNNESYTPEGGDVGPEETLNVSAVNTPGYNNMMLGQNYPNPFSGVTVIPFSLQSPANTSIKVFDILGNEVTTLLNEFISAGKHEITWNTQGEIAGGVYIIQLNAGEEVKNIRTLILN